MKEQWRPIKGFEAIYEVSDRGRVRTIERVIPYCDGRKRHKKSCIRKAPLVAGYPSLFLHSKRKKTFFYVHHLVALAFIGQRPRGKEVAHSDGNPKNNCVFNLRYATAKENDADKIKHGTRPRGEKNGHAILTPADVLAIRKRVAKGELQKIVALDYGLRTGHLNQIVHRGVWAWLD